MYVLGESVSDFLFPGARAVGEAPERHLDETMEWLCRAQDAGADDGVARMFHLSKGWGASYPETTGYIIPTFINYGRFRGRQEYIDRAVRMARWECAVQMADGAVQGGTVADEPRPAIFNTGQALFGWVAVYGISREARFLDSLRGAADYLVEMQDPDGMWRRNLSRFCSAPVDTYAYNVRSAWGLLLAAHLTGDERYRDAAARNLSGVTELTDDGGWAAKNCLDDPDRPLLHTIAYTHQGMLECALLLDEQEAVEKVMAGARSLRRALERYGRLHGRYTADWSPAVGWRCLTGEAQTAVVWHRLAQITDDDEWGEAASRLTDAVSATQKLDGRPETRGGVKGSFPVYGWYGRYEYLNWAAKFHADALMLELGVAGAGENG